MSQKKEEAQEAIYAGIARVAGEMKDWTPDTQATMLRELAAAYRMAAGGQQPGSSIVTQ
ncbi:hypothetical protein [Nocardioides sp. Soil777]|uniref:hypothetical protein n=1 Tax=Nocardioides sp. Soil777 TaxID=1736409 RepID=UPI000AD36F33|nr:hypothetical protein [Nocardioides sp. Soil777]